MIQAVPDITIGSKVNEPVVDSQTGRLLIGKGVVITENLRNTLLNYMNNRFNKFKGIRLDTITDEDCVAMSKLNFAEVLVYSSALIDKLLEDKSPFTTSLKLLKNYDNDTYQHSINVATYSVAFGLYLGLEYKKLQWLASGALVHDIGKLGIPAEILFKRDKLTEEEFNIVKFHPEKGKQILKQDLLGTPIPVIEIAGQHHENWDGSGYPLKLKGNEIYNLAMIVHICDVYDALVQKRYYKDPMSRDKVWKILYEGRGTQFDPELLDKFSEAMPRYIVGENVYNQKIIKNHLNVTVFAYDKNDMFNPMVSFKDEVLRLNELMERY